MKLKLFFLADKKIIRNLIPVYTFQIISKMRAAGKMPGFIF